MKASLRSNAWVIMVALVAQYILGMATMAFVKFPEGATTAQNWDFANSQLLLGLHMAVGTGLVIASVIVLVRSFLQKNKMWQLVSIIGFAAILVAGAGGERFVSTQIDGYSFVMGLGFIAAFAAYGWGLYASKNAV